MTQIQKEGYIPAAEPDKEIIRISNFQEVLARLTVQPLTVVVDTNNIDPLTKAKNDFYSGDYTTGATFYALPEIFHELNEGPLEFNPIDSDEKSSRHGVFFGTLALYGGIELAVAVKPHEADDAYDPMSRREAENTCLSDYFVNCAASRCGFETLQPVGFILEEGGTQYSLTVLDEELESLDGADWSKFFDPGYETQGMRNILYKTALLAAMLHNTGDSYHGDFAPRNVGTTPYGQVFSHDWEKGKVTHVSSSDTEERFGKSWLDIQTFMVSLVKPRTSQPPGIGLFKGYKGDWWASFKEIFFDDYLQTRLIMAQQGSHHMRKLKGTMDELTQLENALHMEMDRWQSASRHMLRDRITH